MESDACVMCRRTVVILLWRPRPMHRSEYAVCLGCARQVREDQDQRAQEAIRQAERSGV